MIDNLKLYLQQTASISEEEFNLARPYLLQRTLNKGDYFMKEGQICKDLAFVVKGLLRSYFLDKNGHEVTICFEPENNFSTAYKSLILQCPSNVSISAIEKSELIVIRYENLQKLYSTSMSWLNIGRLFAEKEYVFLEQYASMLNNESAKEKYLRLLSEQPDILKRVKLEYIASFLGINVRTLSRIRKEISS